MCGQEGICFSLVWRQQGRSAVSGCSLWSISAAKQDYLLGRVVGDLGDLVYQYLAGGEFGEPQIGKRRWLNHVTHIWKQDSVDSRRRSFEENCRQNSI